MRVAEREREGEKIKEREIQREIERERGRKGKMNYREIRRELKRGAVVVIRRGEGGDSDMIGGRDDEGGRGTMDKATIRNVNSINKVAKVSCFIELL